MIHLPSLQQLRFLAAIAEHRHFGRAASACAVTQSTLSAGMQELEKRLGVVLVERSRRGVNLTPLGAEVAARGQRLLRDAKDLLEVVQSAREPLVGPLRLGVIPTIGPYLVPAMMPGLVQKFPTLQLYLREEQTAPLLEKLAADQLDVVALALPYDVSRLEVMELAEDPLFVVLPRTHPRAEAAASGVLGWPIKICCFWKTAIACVGTHWRLAGFPALHKMRSFKARACAP